MHLLKTLFVVTASLMVGSCQITIKTNPEPETNLTTFDFVNTDPPNNLLPPPTLRLFKLGDDETHTASADEAFANSLISYSQYVQRYIMNYIEGSDLPIPFNDPKCYHRDVILPRVAPPPKRPPRPSQRTIQLDDKAFERYLRDLIIWIDDREDYYLDLKADYEQAVFDYNEECGTGGG